MIFENTDLWYAAANGCHDALLQLSEDALEAGYSGKVPLQEGLIVAETLARLAAAADKAENYASLARILYYRSQHASDNGDDASAYVFEVEASSLLTMGAEMGNAGCVQVLADYGHHLAPEAIALVGINQPLIVTLTSPAGSA